MERKDEVFVLVICNVRGDFRKAFSKINKAAEKVKNLEVFVVGEFFSDRFPITSQLVDAVSNEGNKLPCSINVLMSSKEVASVGENKEQIGDNIHISTGLNWLKTASGVGVVFWTEEVNRDNDNEMSTVLNDALTRLAASKCDLLLTTSFPMGVYNFTGDPLDSKHFSSLNVSKLAKAVCPRYHFCPNPLSKYHQRHPYRNDNVLAMKKTNHTRFITLSNVGSSQKWAYFFGIDLNKLEVADIQTECPYTVALLKGTDSNSGGYNTSLSSDQTNASFRWSSSNDDSFNDNSSGNGPQSKRRRSNLNNQIERECWFCLKTDACEKHLIVYINDNSTFYVALAKGAIHPDHVLIVPVDHHKSAAMLPEDLELDLEMLKTQVFKFYEAQGKDCVIYERSYTQVHFVLQIVPVRRAVSKNLLTAFHSHVNKINGINLESIRPPSTLKMLWEKNEKCNYFHVEFPSGDEFFIPLRISTFPINFGRQFLCDPEVLNCPRAADWRSCVLSKAEEEENRNSIKDAFSKFLAEYTASDI